MEEPSPETKTQQEIGILEARLERLYEWYINPNTLVKRVKLDRRMNAVRILNEIMNESYDQVESIFEDYNSFRDKDKIKKRYPQPVVCAIAEGCLESVHRIWRETFDQAVEIGLLNKRQIEPFLGQQVEDYEP